MVKLIQIALIVLFFNFKAQAHLHPLEEISEDHTAVQSSWQNYKMGGVFGALLTTAVAAGVPYINHKAHGFDKFKSSLFYGAMSFELITHSFEFIDHHFSLKKLKRNDLGQFFTSAVLTSSTLYYFCLTNKPWFQLGKTPGVGPIMRYFYKHPMDLHHWLEAGFVLLEIYHHMIDFLPQGAYRDDE